MIGICLGLFALISYVFHEDKSFTIIGTVLISIALITDLCYNEFLPRLFPNSFITIQIREVRNE